MICFMHGCVSANLPETERTDGCDHSSVHICHSDSVLGSTRNHGHSDVTLQEFTNHREKPMKRILHITSSKSAFVYIHTR